MQRATATACLILIANALLLVWASYRQTLVYDEVGHLPAGLYHLSFRRFDMYAVNPPLVRSVAAIPVTLAGFTDGWRGYTSRISDRPEFRCGNLMVAGNSNFLNLWRFGRWACLPFSLLGGIICFMWAKDLYGARAGISALLLWCTCPNILGTGAFILPDVGAASLGVACCYCFWKWLKKPTWQSAILLGLVLGLTELTKFTWILLYLLFPIVWVIRRMTETSPAVATSWKSDVRQLVVALLLGWYVINVGYCFEGTFEPLGEYKFSSAAFSESGPDTDRPGNRFRHSFLSAVPVPLPKNYLLGIDHIKYELETGYWSYLRGEYRHGGWWYYYLYAMLVKLPVGTLLLLLMVIASTIRRRLRFDEIVLLLPALTLITLVSSQTGFNHHIRYVLPAFPFLFVFCGAVFSEPCRLKSASGILARAAVVITALSSLCCYPHSGSYFNELAGGPANGWKHLDFSNVGWGQDLLFLRDWQTSNLQAVPLHVVAFGHSKPDQYGMNVAPVILTRDRELGRSVFPAGWYALEVNAMLEHESSVKQFLKLNPVDHAGYSFFIFHLDEPLVHE